MARGIRIAVPHFSHETVTFLKNDTTLEAVLSMRRSGVSGISLSCPPPGRRDAPPDDRLRRVSSTLRPLGSYAIALDTGSSAGACHRARRRRDPVADDDSAATSSRRSRAPRTPSGPSIRPAAVTPLALRNSRTVSADTSTACAVGVALAGACDHDRLQQRDPGELAVAVERGGAGKSQRRRRRKREIAAAADLRRPAP